MRLNGRVAIITGAGKGMGRVFSLRLSQEGAKVVAVTAHDMEGLAKTKQMVEEQGGEIITSQVDVSKEEDTKRMAEETLARFGRIDILVNNAAIYYGVSRLPFYELDPKEWDQLMEVNVKGPWLCTRAVYPQMKAQGKGKIINIASSIWIRGSLAMAHYVTSKAAVVGLTHALARELGDYGILVNTVGPGFTMTEAGRLIRSDEEAMQSVVKGRCIKRLEFPEDLAGIVAFLASDDSDFITGQFFVVDGGTDFH